MKSSHTASSTSQSRRKNSSRYALLGRLQRLFAQPRRSFYSLEEKKAFVQLRDHNNAQVRMGLPPNYGI